MLFFFSGRIPLIVQSGRDDFIKRFLFDTFLVLVSKTGFGILQN